MTSFTTNLPRVAHWEQQQYTRDKEYIFCKTNEVDPRSTGFVARVGWRAACVMMDGVAMCVLRHLHVDGGGGVKGIMFIHLNKA